jgi:hypothetical protein
MRAFVAALLLLTLGCDLAVSCTLIGCSNGLSVSFDSAPTTGFRIEITSPGSAAKHVIDCPDPARCGPLTFDDFMPHTATITVTTSTGSRTFTRTPEYTEVSPNGERCGPTCRQATVTVSLP